jgi:hypothetical protein
MKQIFRASLVVLMFAGVYAGFSTPAPAMTSPQHAIVTNGIEPVPTTPTTGGGSGGTGTGTGTTK